MVSIKEVDSAAQILLRLDRLEESLVGTLRDIQQRLSSGQEVIQVFSDGLQAYKKRCIGEVHSGSHPRIIERIRQDRQLRFPHRKIVETLLSQYDFKEQGFTELHFSRLVREARVGKNRAKGYLSLLTEKGYVQRRDDGYRKFFKLLD